MRRRGQAILFAGATVVGLAGVSVPAVAQDAPAAESESAQQSVSSLEQIIVTARRREESAQEVPISITAFSNEALIKQDIRTVTDLERQVPAISICCGRGNPGFSFIRGVPGVLGYFAEVPTPLGGSGLFFDLASTQVLKGPQGTLFGLSTNGGAVLYEPARPSEEFGGYGSVTVGDYGRQGAEAVVNLPASEKFLMRLGALYQHSDGFIRDASTGTMYGNENYWIARMSMTMRLTDRFENYLMANYYNSENRPPLFVPYAVNPNGVLRNAFGRAAVDAWWAEQQALGRYAVTGLSLPQSPRNQTENWNVTDIATFEVSDTLLIKNILGFVQTRSYGAGDTDGTPFPLFETSLPSGFVGPNRAYSEELQVQGKALSDRLTYVAGSFNSWSDPPEPVATFSTAVGARSGSLTSSEAKTNALYVEGTYAITDTFDVTAGYRYTWDERDQWTQNLNAAGAPSGGRRVRHGEWQKGTYRVSVTWQPTSDTLVYLTNSKGYSSGGFNAGAATPPELEAYEPESLDNYELGIKSDWFFGDAQLRTNLATYFGKYEDIQVSVTTAVINPVTGTQTLQVLTRNAATGEIKGVEGELTFIPWEWIELTGNFSYMDAEYTKYVGVDPTDTTGQRLLDLSGTAFVFTPEWKYSAGLTLNLPINPGLGRLSLSGTYSWQDKLANTARMKPLPFASESPAFESVNANLNWTGVAGNDALDASLFMTNVTNNAWANGQFGAYDSLGLWGLTVAVPRQWGLRVRYNF